MKEEDNDEDIFNDLNEEYKNTTIFSKVKLPKQSQIFEIVKGKEILVKFNFKIAKNGLQRRRGFRKEFTRSK
jgi:hypothetical protein